MSKVKIFLFLQFIFFSAMPVLAQTVDTAWVRRYNGPGNGSDDNPNIVVDDSGNVYVTGNSTRSSGFYDYTTIKYNPNGDTAWLRRFSGFGNFNNESDDIAVDDSGNVYITGYNCCGATASDMTTIKYSPTGDTLWVRRYNGPGNDADVGYTIAVDDNRNVYVSGRSVGVGTSNDYFTIKYAPNGDTLWVRRYNGPGNGDDIAEVLVVDDSGNVYVTGYSWSGTSYDYSTIKYASDGETVWVRRYNGPGNGDDDPSEALAVDMQGNVYVSGISRGTTTFDDYATIKYSPSGDTLWVRRYDGPPGTSLDQAFGLAVDTIGNVYVTGYSWSGTSYDYATIKYYPNGDTVWVRRYNGPGNSFDLAGRIAVDNSGNVYVTGFSVGIGTSEDYATIWYAPNGDTLWVRRYDGGNGDDRTYALFVDKNSKVYVTGQSTGSGTGLDWATIKYFRNRPPILALSKYKTGVKNDSLIIPVAASDSDATIPVLSASNLPANSNFIDNGNGTGTFIFIPDASQVGKYTVNIIASDGYSSDTETVNIHVFVRHDVVTIKAHSPVNLVVTDPKLDSIGINFNTILEGSSYDTTQDVSVPPDGEKDDVVTIPKPYLGEYKIRVVPEDTGLFSLGIRIDGNDEVILANNVVIPDTDTTFTYTFNVFETLRGDVNEDKNRNLTDIIFLVNYIFKGGPAPDPKDLGNVNCSVGAPNLSDIIYMVNYVFKGGPPPCS